MNSLKLHTTPCAFLWVVGPPLPSDTVLIYSNGLVMMWGPFRDKEERIK